MVPLSHGRRKVQSRRGPVRGDVKLIGKVTRHHWGMAGNDTALISFFTPPPTCLHPGAYSFSKVTMLIFFPLSPGGLEDITIPRD